MDLRKDKRRENQFREKWLKREKNYVEIGRFKEGQEEKNQNRKKNV